MLVVLIQKSKRELIFDYEFDGLIFGPTFNLHKPTAQPGRVKALAVVMDGKQKREPTFSIGRM